MTVAARVGGVGFRSGLTGLLLLLLLAFGLGAPSRAAQTDLGMVSPEAPFALARTESGDASAKLDPVPIDPPVSDGLAGSLAAEPVSSARPLVRAAIVSPTAPTLGTLGPRGPPR